MLERETNGDPARRRRILAAVRRYQETALDARPGQFDSVADTGLAKLARIGGTGPPLVFIPSLVNPPWVLDLGERSLARFLAAQGWEVFLVHWQRPAAGNEGPSLAGLVEQHLLPLLGALERPVLAGYCLGSVFAAAAARLLTVRGLLTLASTWTLSAYGDTARAELTAYWRAIEPLARKLGAVSMDLVQPAFWSLDPALPVRKFERYAAMPPASDAAARFERMEDWANGGTPLPLAAAAELFERGFGDCLFEQGWTVAGTTITPEVLSCPWLDIRAEADRIVPAAAAAPAPEQLTVPLGHVGMIVGSEAPRHVWNPVAQWLETL
ncbi:hypothetical protein B5C34_03250 [Pacificimonas flava]|uniref:Polyhydroxyalkanoic acid synthase n=2 Tax=Pacificimonas TaxID=1960290 RepID=A0A219B2I7_9SPHN|nr:MULTISPECIES: alpha/beta hydrolase [Pacificimonas]MBZ6377764.1 alpha/beta hydrolase [Pacificimonas aurantium]OWV32560.1 hypothetical protein B5C34_03250 [Pacificimonas flava]